MTKLLLQSKDAARPLTVMRKRAVVGLEGLEPPDRRVMSTLL